MNIWQRINFLTHATDNTQMTLAESSIIEAEDVEEEKDDFITNVKPLELKKVKLLDTGKVNTALNKKVSPLKPKDLNGKENPKMKILKREDFGKAKLEQSTKLTKKKSVQEMTVYDYMLHAHRESQ